ncbi:RICIN domain-containing protein [Fodinicola feengrottensis]|uniref:Ricin B lectin domain-containing protein n=1 Tax=Fodinicola feengrottensis TaxID=435914 RepID=A0ABP4V8K1_9ACTN|nr:RICIN domain-containing protein [Fodinicola feengrottensis]
MLVTLRKIAAVGLIAFLTVLGGTATASAQPNAAVRRIHNMNTGRCIDDSDFGFRTNACNRSAFQQWTFFQEGIGGYQFRNADTGRCIDDSDFGFRTNVCNFKMYQTFFDTL